MSLSHSPIYAHVYTTAQGTQFRLLEDVRMTWVNKKEDRTIVIKVPKGFVSNFATIPRVFWGVLSPLDLKISSLVHDYLYSPAGVQQYRLSRLQADILFRRMVRVSHGAVTTFCVYHAVRWFGSSLYDV